jgi:UPF0755 protein
MLQKNKISFKNILTRKQYIIVLIFFIAVLSLLYYTFFTPNYFGRNSFRIDINKGTTLNEVIDTLFEAGIIPGKRNMRIAAFLLGAEKNIKAGRYLIPNGISYVNLVEMFKGGKFEVPVYIHMYDGISDKALARILKEKLNIDSVSVIYFCNNQDFIDSLGLDTRSLEGYLLPGDYYFYKDATVREILEKLNEGLNNFLVDSLKQRINEMKYNLHQILTMASIIQGESKKVEEYSAIAGVYYNRLKKGMKLQADPTIQFSLNTGWRRLLNRDLLINSPYNTYMHYGLPPGPINNPGKAAILAALYPANSNYYYFVADGTGGHKFSRNYSEHLKAVREYRRWFSEQYYK